jgi:hypothetical protein
MHVNLFPILVGPIRLIAWVGDRDVILTDGKVDSWIDKIP